MLKTFNVQETIEKEVVGFGNGSIVYTPKKWIGKKVLVVLEEKPLDIEGSAMELLKPYLSSVEGVFLYGSFARGEQTEESDVDIVVIADKKIPLKRKGRFDFLVEGREEFIEKLREDFHLFLYQMVSEAKPILNESLLDELKEVKVEADFEKTFEETLGAFKNTQMLLGVDKKRGRKYLTSNVCVYSLILRLRTLLLIQYFLKKQKFSNKKFKEMVKGHGFKGKTVNDFFEVYRAERDDRKTSVKILLSDAEKLFEVGKKEFLKTEELVKK